MEYIVIYRLLELQQHLPLQVSALITSALNIQPTIIKNISSHLLQISAQDTRVMANDVEELDTKLMLASSVVQNSSHQVLE